MALGDLLTKSCKVQILAPTPLLASIPPFSLDCSITEKHSRESPPTEFEIENGQTVSDHIIIKPFALKIQGLITDTPLSALQGLIVAGAGLASSLALSKNPGVLTKATAGLALSPALSGLFDSSKSVAAYQTLIQLQNLKLPLTVITSLFRYNNMFIRSLSAPRDNKTGKTLVFDLDLIQLLLVSPLAVNISNLANADVAAGASSKGSQAGKAPGSEAAARGYASGNAAFGVK